MKNLITKMFDLEERKIRDIDIITTDEDVFAIITLKAEPIECPHCKATTSRTHDYRQRTINHAILNGHNTCLVYNQRRYFCSSCRKAFPEPNPFVFSGRRISKYTILRVMKMLMDPRVTFSMAASATDLSVSSVQRIFDMHAGIKTRPFPKILCIDEVYAVKYHQKVYACVLVDFSNNQIYDLLPSRKKYDLANYFSQIPRETRESVQYISMDMWNTYRELANLYFKNALVCVDSFHVVQMINTAFRKTRIRIMNSYNRKSDEYYLMKKFAWLLSKEYRKLNFSKPLKLYRYIPLIGTRTVYVQDLIASILSIDPELEVAYMLKEDYLTLNQQCSFDDVESALDNYIERLELYDVTEFRSVKRSLRNWKQEIINSFNKVDGRRISNGPVESVNARIKLIKFSSNGYTNFERFRKRVLYSLNDTSSIKF